MFGRLVLMAIVTVLVGCATVPSGEGLVLVRHGRFALNADGAEQSPVSVQGNFTWRESDSGWTLELLSPLGATMARLSVTPSGALLEEPHAPSLQASSADQLLARVLQEPVPVDAMKDWLKGQVAQSRDLRDVRRDESGRIIGFSQAGWVVSLDRYDDIGPRLISVSSQGRKRTVTLRLVVDDAN